VQAIDPGHYAITSAAGHDAEGFYRQELEFRREAGYPPFAFLAAFAISGLSERVVGDQADVTARTLIQLKSELNVRVEILGPAQSPLYRLRNRFRRQILLKSANRNDLHRLISVWRQRAAIVSSVRISVDIDPVDLM
jgi:primosomal protein N' (replication factor Y)